MIGNAVSAPSSPASIHLLHYSDLLAEGAGYVTNLAYYSTRRSPSPEGLIRERNNTPVVTQGRPEHARNCAKPAHLKTHAIQKSRIEVTKQQRNVVLKYRNLQYCKVVNFLTTHVEKFSQSYVVVSRIPLTQCTFFFKLCNYTAIAS